MLIMIGYIIVIVSIFGGFGLAGGHMGALFQPIELLMIGGAAIGAFVVANGIKVLKATGKTLPRLFKGSKYNREVYEELLSLLYCLLAKARTDGFISIESDVEAPEESAIFSNFPKILAQHHVMEFLTDYLRMMITGSLNPHQIEGLMDSEIECHHAEGSLPSNALTKLADGMPAFGIIAAVMGVVHTMESVGLPPSELGVLVARALVGTFLGILLGYGFIGPLATLAEHHLAEESKALNCIKVTLLAYMNGYLPQLAVEFGRKVLYSTERPTSRELEERVKELKKPAASAATS